MSRTGQQWTEHPALPASDYVNTLIYTDPHIFEEEQKLLKRATWKLACHESEIPENYDYRTIDHAGYSIIVVRGEDGKIRAFINACSHRSATVLGELAGNAKHWTCPFHNWTYDTKGNCISITLPEGYEESGVCKEKAGLREVRTGMKFGLVFINIDDDAPSFDEFFGDAFEILEDVMGVEPLEVFHHHRAMLNANWKTWHETNMEFYHEFLHYVNRNVAMGSKTYFERKLRLYPNGHGTVPPMQQTYERIGWKERDSKPLPGMKPSEFRILLLFPDTCILIRTTAIRIDTTTPISPNLTLVEQRGFGVKGEPEDERRMRVKDHNQFWGPFGRNFPEDGIAVEFVEKNLRNGAAPYGIFARREDLICTDDALIRSFYEEWGKYMGRPAHNPTNVAV